MKVTRYENKMDWKYNGNNLPVVHVEDSAKVLPSVTTKHTFWLIPILLFLGFCVYFKNVILGERVIFTKGTLAIGFLIGIILFPVHEILHAACFPPGSETFLFYTKQGLGTTCTSPVSRNRFIVVNLLPSVILGLFPLLLYLMIPKEYVSAATILFAIAFLQVSGSYADYINVVHLLRLPAKSTIQISGEKIYWRKKGDKET